MLRHDCLSVLDYLSRMVDKGYTLLTWNGLAFDFDVLSEESGDFDRCRDLALNHVDMMFQMPCFTSLPGSPAFGTADSQIRDGMYDPCR